MEQELITILAVMIVGLGMVWVQASDSESIPVTAQILVLPGQVQLDSPNGGEDWQIGTTQTIVWQVGAGVETVAVAIQRTTDGGWETIASNVPADLGEYPWVVTGPTTTTALVRILSVVDGEEVTDVSSDIFEITPAPVPPPPDEVQSRSGGQFIDIPLPPRPLIGDGSGWWPIETYHAQVLRRFYNLQMVPGADTTISVIALNTGQAVWYNYGRYPTRLGVVGDQASVFATPQWEKFDRVAVVDKTTTGANEIHPGQLGRFNLTLRAPQQSGIYTERFALVTEYITWFPNTEIIVNVTVGTSAIISQPSRRSATSLRPRIEPPSIGGSVEPPSPPQPRVIAPKQEPNRFLSWLSRTWSQLVREVSNLLAK